MFLKAVKAKEFADSKKIYGGCPFENSHHDSTWRKLCTNKNEKPDEIYYVVGVTSIKEGWSEYLGFEDGCRFRQTKSHKVYIVAKGLGQRFKVLPEHLEEINSQ